MKRLVAIAAVVALVLTGCAGNDDRVSELEVKVVALAADLDIMATTLVVIEEGLGEVLQALQSPTPTLTPTTTPQPTAASQPTETCVQNRPMFPSTGREWQITVLDHAEGTAIGNTLAKGTFKILTLRFRNCGNSTAHLSLGHAFKLRAPGAIFYDEDSVGLLALQEALYSAEAKSGRVSIRGMSTTDSSREDLLSMLSRFHTVHPRLTVDVVVVFDVPPGLVNWTLQFERIANLRNMTGWITTIPIE